MYECQIFDVCHVGIQRALIYLSAVALLVVQRASNEMEDELISITNTELVTIQHLVLDCNRGGRIHYSGVSASIADNVTRGCTTVQSCKNCAVIGSVIMNGISAYGTTQLVLTLTSCCLFLTPAAVAQVAPAVGGKALAQGSSTPPLSTTVHTSTEPGPPAHEVGGLTA